MHVAPTRSVDHGTGRARPDARAVCYLMGQVLAFGEKSGIEPQHLDMVMQTMSSHPGLQEYATRMRERRFDDVGFDLLGGLKDVQLIFDASTETRVPFPFAHVIRDGILAALAHGLGAKDVTPIRKNEGNHR